MSCDPRLVSIEGGDEANILHVLSGNRYICGQIDGGYFYIEDIIENGFEYVQIASAMTYTNIAMCTECWNQEILAIHLLREL